jgi:L-asparaginase II
MPADAAMLKRLVSTGEAPTINGNNCSGKHTAMLAYAQLRGWPLDSYLDLEHPLQQEILAAFAGMCGIAREHVELGVDGCSAPNFAVPLYHAALGFARLCDPSGLPQARAAACAQITAAMTAHPEMVSGPGEFDCELMKAGAGRVVCKRGAEGYQTIGLLPGALGADTPGVGIAFKVSDGDASRMSFDLETRSRVRPAVTLEILRQLGALGPDLMESLAAFGPVKPILNLRGLVTGESRPVFELGR